MCSTFTEFYLKAIYYFALMVNRNINNIALYEIWKLKNPRLPDQDYYAQIVPKDSTQKKLGLFLYDFRAEVVAFDRSSINPIGAIINKRM
ncbi:MAG TPA: hypothetical protein PLE30_06415 [Candidatus Kapabacteria bacterium]|nr:hypothetical protein [Candidatus Kapabacteria bacterium]